MPGSDIVISIESTLLDAITNSRDGITTRGMPTYTEAPIRDCMTALVAIAKRGLVVEDRFKRWRPVEKKMPIVVGDGIAKSGGTRCQDRVWAKMVRCRYYRRAELIALGMEATASTRLHELSMSSKGRAKYFMPSMTGTLLPGMLPRPSARASQATPPDTGRAGLSSGARSYV